MFVALDFGSSLIKALIFDGEHFKFYKFSLSYSPQSFSRKSVSAALEVLQNISGQKILKPETEDSLRVYLCTALSLSFEDSDVSPAWKVESSSRINSLWEKDVLDYGYQFIRFRDRASALKFNSQDLLKWLSFKASLPEIENYIGNRQIYSNVLPISPRDLYIEQALARECIYRFFRDQRLELDSKEIVLSGSVFGLNPFSPQSLLILLDSLGFQNQLDVYLDRASNISLLGLVKLFEPEAFKLVPSDLFPVFLATVKRFVGDIKVFVDTGLEKKLEIIVKKDTLFLFPLKMGEKARVEILDKSNQKSELELIGGEMGFVLDCRTFPLDLPSGSEPRVSLLKDWERSLGATGRIFNI